MIRIKHDFTIAGSQFNVDISIQKERYEQLSADYHNLNNYYYDLNEKLAEYIGSALKNRLISPQIYGKPTMLDVVNVAFPNVKDLIKLNVEVWEEGNGENFFILVGDINTATGIIDYHF